MARPVAKKLTPADFPEFPVKRGFLCSMFNPPLAKSTFYDRVNEGKIVSMKGFPGYFLLNASLHRLGLPMRRELPASISSRNLEDITRLAFTLIDRDLFPAPPWMLTVDAIEAKDWDLARRIADEHRDKIALMDHVHLKLAHFSGVLDAAVMRETGEE